MSSQLPESFFTSETADSHLEDTASMKAAYLWSLLQLIQDDLNSLCRRNPVGILGPVSIQTINRAFAEVKNLLGDRMPVAFLAQFDAKDPPTHSDALVVVSLYRSALRWFKVDRLQEDPYSF